MRTYQIQGRRESIQRHRPDPKREFFYYVFNKPYNVICQFSPQEDKKTLADFLKISKDVYPAGRLDYDSEGLLLLSNDNALKARLLDPAFAHEREYLAFVEGVPDRYEMDRFREGLAIEGYKTKPAHIEIAEQPDWLTDRIPPPRTYETKAYSWLRITLTEGKNRQVRKMTAAIGHPTLRLLRVRIMNIKIDGIAPGDYRALTKVEITELKKLLAAGDRR
jgi:23S rRNA pseudouridine2457 synthase